VRAGLAGGGIAMVRLAGEESRRKWGDVETSPCLQPDYDYQVSAQRIFGH
jgi:hypothetical protein